MLVRWRYGSTLRIYKVISVSHGFNRLGSASGVKFTSFHHSHASRLGNNPSALQCNADAV